MNNLYFDIAATTPLDNNVSKLMTEIQNTVFGNPSSIHQFGQKSRSLIETARRQMASSLNCKPNELIFAELKEKNFFTELQALMNILQ